MPPEDKAMRVQTVYTLLDFDGLLCDGGNVEAQIPSEWQMEANFLHAKNRPRPHIVIAEIDDDGVPDVALDHRPRNCPHGSVIGWIKLVEVPGIYLAVVRHRPCIGLIGLGRGLVAAQHERVFYFAVAVA